MKAETLAGWALAIAILSLLNPHIVWGAVNKTESFRINGYWEFSEDGAMGPKMLVQSATFDCTENVTLMNDFECHTCGRKIVEAYGNGACLVNYQQSAWFLRWL